MQEIVRKCKCFGIFIDLSHVRRYLYINSWSLTSLACISGPTDYSAAFFLTDVCGLIAIITVFASRLNVALPDKPHFGRVVQVRPSPDPLHVRQNDTCPALLLLPAEEQAAYLHLLTLSAREHRPKP